MVRFAGIGPEGEVSQLPSTDYYVVVLHNLIEWVTKGTPPPYGERFEIDDNGAVVRDEHGNVCGGVRLSQLEVPTATYIANSTGPVPDMARMIGVEVPFSSATLRALYKDHDEYVANVQWSVEHLVRDGWIFQEHADEYIAEAKAAPIP